MSSRCVYYYVCVYGPRGEEGVFLYGCGRGFVKYCPPQSSEPSYFFLSHTLSPCLNVSDIMPVPVCMTSTITVWIYCCLWPPGAELECVPAGGRGERSLSLSTANRRSWFKLCHVCLSVSGWVSFTHAHIYYDIPETTVDLAAVYFW